MTLGIFSGTTQRRLDFAAGATFAVAECSHRAEGVAPAAPSTIRVAA